MQKQNHWQGSNWNLTSNLFSAVAFFSVRKSSTSQKPKPSGKSVKGTKGLKEGRAHQWRRAQLSYRIVLETLGENLQEDKD